MTPRLDTLPPEQRRLWPELSQVPGHFVLYGGTAIALRLGGRPEFNLILPLKALSYYGEPALASLPTAIRDYLTRQSAQVEAIEVVRKIAPGISASG